MLIEVSANYQYPSQKATPRFGKQPLLDQNFNRFPLCLTAHLSQPIVMALRDVEYPHSQSGRVRAKRLASPASERIGYTGAPIQRLKRIASEAQDKSKG